MIILVVLMCLFVILFLQALVQDMQNHSQDNPYNISKGNLTLSSLISDSVLETWISEPPTPQSKAWKSSPPAKVIEKSSDVIDDTAWEPGNETNLDSPRMNVFGAKQTSELQSDDSSVPSPPSKDYFVKSLFEVPKEDVEADWSVVLGTFDHYDDTNWNDFLVKTEVPLLVRMFLSGSSETVTISRQLKPKKKKSKQGKKHVGAKSHPQSDYEILIATASWLLTHESRFRLKETYIEHDLDGTDSKNTFFFSSPRLLIHNKIKDKWRTAIVRHFDETGLNMTFVDRDRLVVARRFFKRIR